MYAFFAEFCRIKFFFMTQIRKPDIEEGWYQVLKTQFEADYFSELKKNLLENLSMYEDEYDFGSKSFEISTTDDGDWMTKWKEYFKPVIYFI